MTKLDGNLESKMEKDYDHILNIDYDRDYKIQLTNADTMIFSNNREKEKLDGEWNFSIDVYDTGIRKKFFEEVTTDTKGRALPVDFSFDQWEKISVPGSWNNAKAEYTYYEGSSWYTRKFDYVSKAEKERVFLTVGAANYECRIWLNKKLIARHIGGYTPMFVEITENLQDENRLLIMVNNTRKLEAIPSINFDWCNYGGIHRSVELIKVPQSFIKDFEIHLVADGNYKNIEVIVTTLGKVEENCKIFIPELDIEKDIEIDKLTGKGKLIFKADVELWSFDNPKLYNVSLQYSKDKIDDLVGFRQISTSGCEILLNGKKIFLKGVCAHEESMESGRAVKEEEIIQMITHAKEMNCNFIRLTHYPHNERVAKLADKMGIMLWEEIPVYWALEFENKSTFENAQNQLKELIIRDKNRASVIIWSIGNENPDTDVRLEFMKGLAQTCREMDSTRMISAACLVNIDELKIKDRLVECIDIVGINEYYGWYYREFDNLISILDNSNIGKPIIISETGGEAVPIFHGSSDELYTEECQQKIYEKQFDIIDKFENVCGITPWILYDYKTAVRLNHYQKGINLKGLISKERNYRKQAFYTVKEYYRKKD